ncbi:uncharacterized protein LOC119167586 isoform X1 [Rhipicephalus microplus]|uniref:uncharacterized protein LOC119167586 isoform X1 n=2 Tax=Rhipicephalus microplus TaxID=6941 RepID=UPI003F6BB909
MAPLKSNLYSLSPLLIFSVWTAQIGSLSGGYMKYYVELMFYEDGAQRHPLPELQRKDVYYTEVAMAVTRRLELLRIGQFKVIIKGIYRLTTAQSNAVFFKKGRLASIEEAYRNIESLLKRNSETHVHHKDFAVVVTGKVKQNCIVLLF